MDEVTITCYNKTTTHERKEATDFYRQALCGCDSQSSEADRYRSVLFGLRHGYTIINDDWAYREKE